MPSVNTCMILINSSMWLCWPWWSIYF